KRRALRLLQDEVLQVREAGVVAQQEGQQFLGCVSAQRRQTELRVIGLTAPLMPILGSVVHQQQQAGRGYTLTQGIEKPLGLAVNPVQVFKDQDHQLVEALPQEEFLDGRERPLPPDLRLRVHLLQGGGRIVQAEQGEEVGQGLFEATVQHEHLAADFLPSRALVVLRLNLKIALEQVEQGQIWGCLAVGHGQGVEHQAATGGSELELVEQARFA